MIWTLVITFVLSLIGVAFYHLFVKGHYAHWQAKAFLYTIVLGGMLIPFTSWQIQPEIKDKAKLISYSTMQKASCDNSEAVAECERIWAEGGACDPNVIVQQNLIPEVYAAHTPKESWEAGMTKFVILGCLAAIGLLIIRLGALFILIGISQKRSVQIDGRTCITLSNTWSLGFSSFKIFRNYLIWVDDPTLSKEELEAILLHEVSHLKQRNTWELITLNLIQIVWFFNPMFYYIRNEIIELSEYIADEHVLRHDYSPKWYADLLLRMQSRMKPTFAFSFKGGQLKNRFENILNRNKPSSGLKLIPILMIVFFSFFTVSYYSLFGSTTNPTPSQDVSQSADKHCIDCIFDLH